jgi:hypothetical protein
MSVLSFRVRKSFLYIFAACCLLLSGAESLRPWGARSVNNAVALLSEIEAIKAKSPSSTRNEIQLIKPLPSKLQQKIITKHRHISKEPIFKTQIQLPSSLFLPTTELPAPVAVQAAPRHLGAAVLGTLSLADLDRPDPLVPPTPPAPLVQVRLPVAGICKPEQVKLLVERLPGGSLRGEPRWLGAKPSLALERRLQVWLDQPIPGAPSVQQLVVQAEPLRQDRQQIGASCK